ncbi:MAG: type I DNA topoisomerase [Firmicutes bacterium]|nr:type I DNA topoisomerase [Bacillota bacterium]
MADKLVIVESPAKARTISKILGRSYKVKASNGHIVDLPRSQFAVDIKNNFKPKYITIRGRGKIIKELKDSVKKVDRVYLATDPDREGEAISWHLAQTLELNPASACRIEFHEITKRAIKAALENPRPIDLNRVNAQQARRVLDRLFGYMLSPLLWVKVRRGLSAGRVQSAALRLICQREAEIEAFQPEEYWTIDADFVPVGREQDLFTAKLIQVNGEKATIPDAETANNLKQRIEAASFRIVEVKKRERKRYPAPPFITSTLQQEASRKLGFSARKTMSVAQELYEGLEIGNEGSVGLITYIRTDSVRVAQEAQEECRSVIAAEYGKEYLPAKPPFYKTKSTAVQGAHEAIRPTVISRRPQEIKAYLTRDQFRLYQFIWDRFVASQMEAAVLDVITVEMEGDGFLFRANGSKVKFPGFLVLYKEDQDDKTEEEEGYLPELQANTNLALCAVRPEQHFTQPPARYSEALLVKTLEENGIGRPSTYATIIETLRKRSYVEMENKRFKPTELGLVVDRLLKENFPRVVDLDFTARMEEKLDQVEEGTVDWVSTVRDFYEPFSAELKKAEETVERVKLTEEVSEVQCEYCGRMMVYKYGRYGPFLACPGYPECKNIKSIQKETGVACPECQKGQIVERHSKKGRKFFGCNRYPECKFTSWYRPAKTPCPQCGSLCVVKKSKTKGEYITCTRQGCSYEQAASTRKKENQGGTADA